MRKHHREAGRGKPHARRYDSVETGRPGAPVEAEAPEQTELAGQEHEGIRQTRAGGRKRGASYDPGRAVAVERYHELWVDLGGEG